jgi:hypothetical protein
MHRRWRLLASIASVSWLLVGRAGAQVRDTPPPQLVGCYALTVGPWSPPLRDSTHYAIPARVRLDTARAERGPGWKLTPNIQYPGGRSMRGLPNWLAGGDSAVLTWSNGFTPTVVTLHVRDSSLVGEAVALSDAHYDGEPPRPRPPVSTVRRPCSGVAEPGS